MRTENHRVCWVGKDPPGSSNPTPGPVQDTPRIPPCAWKRCKLCTKPEVSLLLSGTPHMLILHTRTHTPTHAPRGFHPLKKKQSRKAAAIGQSEDLTDVLNPSAVVERLPESLEFYWKSLVPRCWAGAQAPENFTSSAGKRGCFSFSWTHTVASCCETMVTEGTAAMETSSIYVHR